jgi:hypothetical protein
MAKLNSKNWKKRRNQSLVGLTPAYDLFSLFDSLAEIWGFSRLFNKDLYRHIAREKSNDDKSPFDL